MNKPFYGVATMPMSQRSQVINHSQSPGPGTYDFYKEKSHNALPKWSLKKRINHGSCFQNLSAAPGPGIYQTDTAFKKLPEKHFSTKGEKYKNFGQKNYGSSFLNLPGALNLKAGYSFGYREIFNQKQKSPGPIYHLDKLTEQKRNVKNYQSSRGFGYGQKMMDNNINKETPGPGTFQIEQNDSWKRKSCQAWTFGSSPKNQQHSGLKLGPGQYDPQQMTMTRTFKFQGRNQPKIKIQNNTGPGSYDIPDTKISLGTKFNISKKKYKLNQQCKSQKRLNPFTYDVKRYMDEPNRQTGYSLGKRFDISIDSIKQCPGPGTYQLSKEAVLKNGGYMGRKSQKKIKQTLSDNFYKYSPNFNSTSKDSFKYSFGLSKRYKQKENDDKSQYSQDLTRIDIKQKTGCSYSIGTAKRFVDLKKESGPFKQMMNNCSTIGNLPSYLKKSTKKK